MAGQELRDTQRKRLCFQGLAGAPFTSVADVVGWLGAVQSQEYAVAKWSVGQRATGLSDAGLDQALAEGTIIRTHVLRPTWHFVAHTDVDGARYWYAAAPPPRPVEPVPRAHLLQPYDEYLVAYRGARAGYDRDGWLSAGRNPFPNGVILDGEYVANWRRPATSKRLTVEVQPVRRLDRAARAAVAEAVERYAGFVGLPASLTIQDGPDA